MRLNLSENFNYLLNASKRLNYSLLKNGFFSALKFASTRKYYVIAVLGLSLLMYVFMGDAETRTVEISKPSVPEHLVVEQSDEGLVARWNPSDGASSYTLFWGTEKGEFRRMFETSETAVLLKGLDPGYMYNFAVTASNPRYESHFSAEIFCVYETETVKSSELMAAAKDLIHDNRLQEALAHLTAAIRLDPKNAESYRARAALLERVGKKKEARSDLMMSESLFNKKQMTSRN